MSRIEFVALSEIYSTNHVVFFCAG